MKLFHILTPRACLSGLLLCMVVLLYANDSRFYVTGNQLIPMSETDIRVKKEILILKKTDARHMEVTVRYVFHNPGTVKRITVGFEALPPYETGQYVKNGRHPYIENFTVTLNQVRLPYEVAAVSDSVYYRNGMFATIPNTTLADLERHSDKAYDYLLEHPFRYVYHFSACFKPGENTLVHTYRARLSERVLASWFFDYVLTAANRWAGGRIGDFTLMIDVGKKTSFSLPATFFDGPQNWALRGKGSIRWQPKGSTEGENGKLTFYILNGVAVFRKKNFRPRGELYVECSTDGDAQGGVIRSNK